MPLSTPAKIGLTLLGTATLIGVGVALSRTGDKPAADGTPGNGGTSKVPDASAPKVQEVVLDLQALFDPMGDRVEQADKENGIPLVLGTRYLLPFTQGEAAQIRSGARWIAELGVGRIENTKAPSPQESPTTLKGTSSAWEISTPTFEVEVDGFTVGFRAGTQTLYVQASRAGLYAVAMRDQDGVEFYDDLLFRAVTGGLPRGNA